MADENLPPEEEAKRSVGRTLRRGFLWSFILGGLGSWAYYGGAWYTLEPGQSAILLRFGEYVETVSRDGVHLTWPAPIVERVVVNAEIVQSEDFGLRGEEDEGTPRAQILEARGVELSPDHAFDDRTHCHPGDAHNLGYRRLVRDLCKVGCEFLERPGEAFRRRSYGRCSSPRSRPRRRNLPEPSMRCSVTCGTHSRHA